MKYGIPAAIPCQSTAACLHWAEQDSIELRRPATSWNQPAYAVMHGVHAWASSQSTECSTVSIHNTRTGHVKCTTTTTTGN
eukprot:359707-Chlamydomonas_euryale.AAC.4